MQPYDLFMLLVLVGATAFGAYKGLAWQIASLGSIVLSYLVALTFSDRLAPVLSEQEPWNKFLAMAILYMLTTLAVWVAFRAVKNAIDRVQLKEFDRQIGGLVGAAKGVLFCVAITFFAVTLSQDARELVLASKSGDYIARFIHKADAIMPQEVHEVLDPYLNRLSNELSRTGAPATSDPPPAEEPKPKKKKKKKPAPSRTRSATTTRNRAEQ